VARSYESLWLWTGATLAGLGTALIGVAGALDSTRPHYALWSSAPAIAAYIAFAGAILCVVCAAREIPYPLATGRSHKQGPLDPGATTIADGHGLASAGAEHAGLRHSGAMSG
jgi:hypothetical protein